MHGQGFGRSVPVQEARCRKRVPIAVINCGSTLTRRVDQSCGLTEDAPGTQDDAGQNTGERGRQYDAFDRFPFGKAKGRSGLALKLRNVSQRVFDVSRQKRQVEKRQRQGTGKNRKAHLELDDEEQVAEQADNDRRKRTQDFNRRSENLSKPVVF